jgi:hypothetical protein
MVALTPIPEAELPDGAPPVSRRYTPPVPVPRAAFHTRPAHPPCAQYIPHRVRPCTTFFSRHGFRSWLSSKIRTVSGSAPGTSLRFTASSASGVSKRSSPDFAGVWRQSVALAIFLRNQSAVAMRSLTEQAGAEPAAYSTRSATGRTPNGKHSFDFELSLGCKAFSFEAGHGARVIQNVG